LAGDSSLNFLKTDGRDRRTVYGETFQTSQPHIHAAGDVIGLPSTASTSIEQGRIGACYAVGKHTRIAGQQRPYAPCSVPELSYVWLSKGMVRQAGIVYETEPHVSGKRRPDTSWARTMACSN
jgi:NAD(P) transhydrogenase